MPRGIYKRTLATRKILSLAHKGKPSNRKGKKASDETKSKMSLAKLGKIEEKSMAWKGKKVGYRGLHIWVQNKLGKPRYCENCGNKSLKHRQYHWSNISGKYKRIISDWRRLCVKCHKKAHRANQKSN